MVQFAYITNIENEKYTVVVARNVDNKWNFGVVTPDEKDLITAIKRSKIEIANAEVKDNKLKGKFASLSRFNPNKPIGIKPVVIISELRIDDDTRRLIGYKIVNSDGHIKNIKLGELINYCSRITQLSSKSDSDAVPIQNAMFVEATDTVSAHIKSYVQNQYYVESVSFNRPTNVQKADINNSNNRRQLSKLEELFNKEQIRELKAGKDSGVNYRIYGNNKLSARQMHEIRKALECGLDPRPYASPEFDKDAIAAYRIQSKYGVDISQFINPKYNAEQIIEISTAWIDGVDISKLANPDITVDEMAKIRIDEESKLWEPNGEYIVLESVYSCYDE